MPVLNSKTDAERWERTKRRKARQKELTAICDYSLADKFKPEKEHYQVKVLETNKVDGYYPLISEGVMVDYDGNPYEIIGRGSLKEWYDNLDPEAVYDIDLDHAYDSALFHQIGTWKKSDLKLVEQDDERYSIMTKLPLDEDSIIVQEIRRKNTPLALSVEFYSDGKWGTIDGYDDPIWVHEHVDIVGYGVVYEPQDANSGNLDLSSKGEYKLDKKENSFMDALKSAFSAEPEAKEPEAKEPEAKEPEAKEAEAKEAEAKEPEAKEPEAKEPEVETFSAEEADTMIKEQLAPVIEEIKAMQKKNDQLSELLKSIDTKMGDFGKFSLPSTHTKTQNSRVGF